MQQTRAINDVNDTTTRSVEDMDTAHAPGMRIFIREFVRYNTNPSVWHVFHAKNSWHVLGAEEMDSQDITDGVTNGENGSVHSVAESKEEEDEGEKSISL